MARSRERTIALAAAQIHINDGEGFFAPKDQLSQREVDHQMDGWEKYIKERDKILSEYGIKQGPMTKLALNYYEDGIKAAGNIGFKGYRDVGPLFGREFQKKHDISTTAVLGAGVRMEEINNEVKATSIELENAVKVLKDSVNQIRVTADIVGPEILKTIKDVRSARMGVATEARQIIEEIKGLLVSLGDVRKFFLESDYGVEMDRLERFVRVCQEIKKLKEEGVFDSIVETSIKMAIKEEKNVR